MGRDNGRSSYTFAHMAASAPFLWCYGLLLRAVVWSLVLVLWKPDDIAADFAVKSMVAPAAIPLPARQLQLLSWRFGIL